jgi:hypothetical protein
MPIVVLVPWYEQEDFVRLRQMLNGKYLPSDYAKWRDRAVAETQALLAQGHSAQLVRLNIERYFGWLCERCEPDTTSARLHYLYHLSGEAGCEVIDVCWPEPPHAY